MSNPTEDESLVPNKRYGSVMSTPNINQLGLDHGDQMVQQAKFNRSASVGPGMTASNLNPRQRNRRALYVNLPFFRWDTCFTCVCLRTGFVSPQCNMIHGRRNHRSQHTGPERIIFWFCICIDVTKAVHSSYLLGLICFRLNCVYTTGYPACHLIRVFGSARMQGSIRFVRLLRALTWSPLERKNETYGVRRIDQTICRTDSSLSPVQSV